MLCLCTYIVIKSASANVDRKTRCCVCFRVLFYHTAFFFIDLFWRIEGDLAHAPPAGYQIPAILKGERRKDLLSRFFLLRRKTEIAPALRSRSIPSPEMMAFFVFCYS